MSPANKTLLQNAAYGFLLGLVFPVLATVVQLSALDLKLSLPIVSALHRGEPLMWIIDLAPLVLAASFGLVSRQRLLAAASSSELARQLEQQARQIQNEQSFLEALIESTSFAVVRLDNDHRIVTCNRAFEDLFGYKCAEIIGEYLDDMISSEELREEALKITASVSEGNLERLISKRMRSDGSLVDVEIVGVPVSVQGEKIGVLGLYHNISTRKQTESALQESEARFKTLFNESPISLWEEDFSQVKQLLDGIGSREEIIRQLDENPNLLQECMQKIVILDVNQATLDLYNAQTKAELIAGLPTVLVEESMEDFKNELIALASGERSFECEIAQRKIGGEVLYGWLRLTLPYGYEDTWSRVFISIMDITDRRRAEEKMRFMSFHDSLTGLYNRAYFEEEMNRLESSRQYPISIIVCDLDNLKGINDNLGHDVGDQAIRAVAKILGSGTFRKEDVVARIGGDEFVILLPSVDLNKQPAILERLENGLKKHNQSKVDDGLYRPISLSYGFAVVESGDPIIEGYKKADYAMYRDKTRKKASKT